jgi:hypothetical protein
VLKLEQVSGRFRGGDWGICSFDNARHVRKASYRYFRYLRQASHDPCRDGQICNSRPCKDPPGTGNHILDGFSMMAVIHVVNRRSSKGYCGWVAWRSGGAGQELKCRRHQLRLYQNASSEQPHLHLSARLKTEALDFVVVQLQHPPNLSPSWKRLASQNTAKNLSRPPPSLKHKTLANGQHETLPVSATPPTPKEQRLP